MSVPCSTLQQEERCFGKHLSPIDYIRHDGLPSAKSSLRTRPFARGARKSLGTRLDSSCPQGGMLTSWIRIVDCKWRHGMTFLQASVPPATRYGKSLCYAVNYQRVFDKTWGNEQSIEIVWVVSLITPRQLECRARARLPMWKSSSE